MPDLYLSNTRRIRHTDGLVVVEYLDIDGVTWVPMEKHLISFEFFDDFFYLNSEKWQLHQAGGTGGTASLLNAEDDIPGGVMQLAVNSGVENNVWPGEPAPQAGHCLDFKLVDGDSGGSWMIKRDSGKKLWYAIKVRMLEIVGVAMYVGLFNPAECAANHGLSEIPGDDPHVTPGTGEPDLSADGFQDGIYYRIKSATPAEIDWAVAKNVTETEVKECSTSLASTGL
ncbi:unnamed protein product [marine sediment metagenome]|uniref:Uncharacterized protein n=1 Tax=marine sediment metagenome TaxID=412755 RepID=X1NL18_9ZZZZ